MLYLPDLFGEDLMDDWMKDFDELESMDRKLFSGKNPLYGRHAKNIMKTDVSKKDGNYEIDVDLPGFHKEDVQLTLENGYLTIATAKGLDKDTKDKKGQIIRRERYSGNMSRSFYVGEEITEEEVQAKFEDGVLHIRIPDKEKEKAIPAHKVIQIAG